MIAGPLSPSVAAALAGAARTPRECSVSARPVEPPLLAVRSSGVAEDGAAASFAGLHDTELGLTADEVAPAVLRCWASLWSERAIGYRARRGLALDGDAMAVVVQALVPARAAAIVFTRHPVSGRSDQLLINAAPGLGEAMVSGMITPDTIVVDKADAGGQSSSRRATPATGPRSPTTSVTSWSGSPSTSSGRSAPRSTSRPPTPTTAGTSSRPARSPRPRSIDDRPSSPSSGSIRPIPRSPGNGTTCTCRGRSRRSPVTTSGSSAPGWRTAIERMGDPGRDADPDLERVRLLRARDRCPGGGTGRRCGSAGPRLRRAAIKTTDAYWHERAVPEVRAAYAWVAARPVETMPAAELAETWDEVWARIGRCWSIHFYAIRGPYQVLDDLADLYESVIEAPTPGEALGLIGGGDHELQAVERGLEELAAIVGATPGLAERLAEPGVDRRGARRGPGREPVRDGARRVPRRARPPRPERRRPDASLVGRGARPRCWPSSPSGSAPGRDRGRGTPRQRLAAEADVLADRARTALAGDPAKLARFEDLLADARQIGHLTETHNYWIDRMAQASLRRFVVRVGRRLADAGVDRGSRRTSSTSIATRSPTLLRRWRRSPALVADRRRDLARFAAIRPAAPGREAGRGRRRRSIRWRPHRPRPTPTSCAGPARRPGSSAVLPG